MRTIALLVSLLATVGGATQAASTPAPVDQHYLAARRIKVPGTLVLARAYTDRDGEHVLVLTRKTGPLPAPPPPAGLNTTRCWRPSIRAARTARGARAGPSATSTIARGSTAMQHSSRAK